jgi:hypothetical protein
MNQFVYNNRVFYFDSAKYSVGGGTSSSNNISSSISSSSSSTINNHYLINKENVPKVINLVIKVIPQETKVKKKESVAGKGYVAAKFLNKIR